MSATLVELPIRVGRAVRRAGLSRVWPLPVIMVLVGCAALLPLNGDVRFEAGAEQSSQLPIAETFTHRPLGYRLLMAAAFVPARLLGESSRGFELAMQLEALLLCAGAALLLGRALLDRGLPVATAWPLAIAVGACCAGQGAIALWEPDWLATLLTMLAVAVGLLGGDARRHWLVFGVAAGVLLAAAAAIKIVTLPIALIGLVAIGLLDRRRAVVAAGAALLAGMAWVAIVAVAWPMELLWLVELSALQPDDGGDFVGRVALGLGSAVLAWPILIMIPAAIMALLTDRPRREMIIGGAVVAALVLLGLLPAIVQRQYFIYHFTALPMIAAGLLVLAAIRAGRTAAARLIIGILISGVGAAVLTRAPAEWRQEQQSAIIVGLVAVMIIITLAVRYAGTAEDRGAARPAMQGLAVAVACGAAMIGINAPGQTGTIPLTVAPTGLRNVNTAAMTDGQRTDAREVRRVIGADTPVLYLAYGEVAYFVRNPTPCRYLSPTWLQRARYNPEIQHSSSYADNLSCLDHPDAQYLLLQVSWFRLNQQPPALRSAIERRFDCTDAQTIEGLAICPRR